MYVDIENLKMVIDGVTANTTPLAGASVPDNANPWVLSANNTIPYMDYYRHSVGNSTAYSFSNPGGTWAGEVNAYDGRIATAAAETVPAGSWGNYIVLAYNSINATQLDFYMASIAASADNMDIDISVGGVTWINIYAADPPESTMTRVNFALYPNISHIRVRFHNSDVIPQVSALMELEPHPFVVWYQPNTIVLTNVLPDRAGGDNPGVITWGTNPAGVGVSLDSLVAETQPSIGVEAEDLTRDILPEAPVGDWFVEPDVSGTLLTHPLRPFVTLLSDTTKLSERQAREWLGIAFVLFVLVLTARSVRGHHLLTGIATAATIGLSVAQTIFPVWALVFVVFAVIAGIVAERSPSL